MRAFCIVSDTFGRWVSETFSLAFPQMVHGSRDVSPSTVDTDGPRLLSAFGCQPSERVQPGLTPSQERMTRWDPDFGERAGLYQAYTYTLEANFSVQPSPATHSDYTQ